MSLVAHVILLPIAAMVVLSAVVGGALLAQRTAEMRRRRIHPQAVATSSQMASKLERTNIADNFRNLFETPVLFYALCLGMAITPSVTPAMFAAGFALLIGMWFTFVLQLVGWA